VTESGSESRETEPSGPTKKPAGGWRRAGARAARRPDACSSNTWSKTSL